MNNKVAAAQVASQAEAVTAMLVALRAVVLDLATSNVVTAETANQAAEALALGETTALTIQEAEDIESAAVLEHRTMNRVNLKSFIEENKGKLVSLDFIKANNEPRTLTGRLGVTAPLKGGDNKSEAAERPLLTMFDIQINGYRNVNLSTVTQVRALGQTFNITD